MPFLTYITKIELNLIKECSVLCKSCFEIQNLIFFLVVFVSFPLIISSWLFIFNNLDFVLISESGDFTSALLFNGLDDHTDSGDLSLSGNQCDFVGSLKNLFCLCYCCSNINIRFSFDMYHSDFGHFVFLKID